jgi:ribosomal protein L31
MRGAIPPLTQYAFMAWCLIKHRDKFTFKDRNIAVDVEGNCHSHFHGRTEETTENLSQDSRSPVRDSTAMIGPLPVATTPANTQHCPYLTSLPVSRYSSRIGTDPVHAAGAVPSS